jgi:hypothetical protein
MNYDVVEQLIDGFETTIQNVLGSDWKNLDYIFEIEKNSLNRDPQKFGVRSLGAFSDTGVTRAMTMNHDFEIMLTDLYINRDGSDEKQRQAVEGLYNKVYKIFNEMFLTKAGKPDIVMTVNRLSIGEPEFFDDDNVAALRSQITVIYRQRLTN